MLSPPMKGGAGSPVNYFRQKLGSHTLAFCVELEAPRYSGLSFIPGFQESPGH